MLHCVMPWFDQPVVDLAHSRSARVSWTRPAVVRAEASISLWGSPAFVSPQSLTKGVPPATGGMLRSPSRQSGCSLRRRLDDVEFAEEKYTVGNESIRAAAPCVANGA